MRKDIKTFSGQVIGHIETKANGDKVVTNFGGVVLGYYKKVKTRPPTFMAESFIGKICPRLCL